MTVTGRCRAFPSRSSSATAHVQLVNGNRPGWQWRGVHAAVVAGGESRGTRTTARRGFAGLDGKPRRRGWSGSTVSHRSVRDGAVLRSSWRSSRGPPRRPYHLDGDARRRIENAAAEPHCRQSKTKGRAGRCTCPERAGGAPHGGSVAEANAPEMLRTTVHVHQERYPLKQDCSGVTMVCADRVDSSLNAFSRRWNDRISRARTASRWSTSNPHEALSRVGL